MNKREADTILLACKKHVVELGTEAKLNFSDYPTRKKRGDSGISWADRRRSED